MLLKYQFAIRPEFFYLWVYGNQDLKVKVGGRKKNKNKIDLFRFFKINFVYRNFYYTLDVGAYKTRPRGLMLTCERSNFLSDLI